MHRRNLKFVLALAIIPSLVAECLALKISKVANLTPGHSASTEKLKPEEIVTKHLASIGEEKNRAAITTRIISGSSLVVFRTAPVGQAGGRAVLASEGIKTLLGMSFQSP